MKKLFPLFIILLAVIVALQLGSIVIRAYSSVTTRITSALVK